MISDFDASVGQVLGGAQYTGGGLGWYPDPFADMASTAMPQTIQSALRWAQYILTSDCTYLSAMERTVRYFLTELVIEGEEIGRGEKEDILSHLNDDLDIMADVEAVVMDELCYGNTFNSVLERFRRYWICGNARCRYEVAFDQMDQLRQAGRAEWSDFAMTATCPRCGVKSAWAMHDRRGGTDCDHVIKRWSPIEMELLHDPLTGRVGHIWKIPEEERRGIVEGRPDVLREAPAEVIEAVKTRGYLRIGRDLIYHGKERTFAGQWNRGWGISRVFANFRQVWYTRVLHRYNEAIGLDYVMPFRVLTPDAGAGASPESADPLLSVDLAGYNAHVERMLLQHRRDPAGWNFLPFPIKYQSLGGEAAELAPYQLLDQAQATLLDGMNVPVQFYKMDLTVQAAPLALRLFESVHRAVPRSANRFLRHVMKRLCRLKGWPNCTARLVPPSIVDDLNKQLPRLQLMGSGAVSPQTALASLGLDAFAEQRKTLEYQQFQAEQQEKMQEQMEQGDAQRQLVAPPLLLYQQQLAAQQQSGQGPPQGQGQGQGQGGPPPPPQGAAGAFQAMTPSNPNVPVEPGDIMAKAQSIAGSLMPQPEATKNQYLAQLKQRDPLLHLAVKDALRKGRDQVRAQAGDQAMGKVGAYGAARRLGIRPRGWRPPPPPAAEVS